MPLYREHRVYRHRGRDVMLYVCFEDLSSGLFTVQQREFLRPGDDFRKRSVDVMALTLELFVQIAPSERSRWGPSIELAVEVFDCEFGN
jgi:hypothetical protein